MTVLYVSSSTYQNAERGSMCLTSIQNSEIARSEHSGKGYNM